MGEASRIVLCRLDELPESGSRGFSLQTDAGTVDLFVVRRGGRVFAYLNSCPHTGAPLDWVPDRFLNPDGDHIQCATHDALFRIEDGHCIAGPCAGAHLSPLRVVQDEGQLLLDSASLPPSRT